MHAPHNNRSNLLNTLLLWTWERKNERNTQKVIVAAKPSMCFGSVRKSTTIFKQINKMPVEKQRQITIASFRLSLCVCVSFRFSATFLLALTPLFFPFSHSSLLAQFRSLRSAFCYKLKQRTQLSCDCMCFAWTNKRTTRLIKFELFSFSNYIFRCGTLSLCTAHCVQ